MIWTPERVTSARQTLQEWHGTPHGYGKPVVGQRIDCINIIGEILMDAGIAPRVKIPRIVPDGKFNYSDKVKNGFGACLFVNQHLTKEGRFGDIAIFETGTMDGHCGFVDPPHIWHSLSDHFLIRTEWRIWSIRVQCVLRIVKDGLRSNPHGIR